MIKLIQGRKRKKVEESLVKATVVMGPHALMSTHRVLCSKHSPSMDLEEDGQSNSCELWGLPWTGCVSYTLPRGFMRALQGQVKWFLIKKKNSCAHCKS